MRSYALITGAAGGLGKAMAAECAFRGWDLYLLDISAELLPPLAQGLSRLYGVNVLYTALDLTDPAAREGFWERMARLGNRFHLLVNVAGREFEGPFRERRVTELRAIVRLNIEATIEMTRRALEFRDPARPLRVLTVSSLASFQPMPIKAVYAASKRFLLDLTLALRQEFMPAEATFTALCPAGLPTTPQSIRGIEAQGFWGHLTARNVGDVAAAAVSAAQAGRALCIPGWPNRILQGLGGLLPPQALAVLVGRRWRAAHRGPAWAREQAVAVERQTVRMG